MGKSSITTLNQNDSSDVPLYIQLYNHYKGLISSGILKAESKLPSIRRCANERIISRTTVEAAYLQLAAEGYITSKPGSGFYVNDLNYMDIQKHSPIEVKKTNIKSKPLYDFATSAVDYKSFNFDLWSRYMKSALRNGERLLSYGDPQGEYDLRVVLSKYVGDRRGVICTPEQIVIGAGVQSLLQILCSLTGVRSPVSFAGGSFKQARAVFSDRGFDTISYDNITNDLSSFSKDKVKIIYTSPSHITPWGDVMPMQTRLELLSFANTNDCLIIEDDYDSEFRYYSRPVPSLQGLDGGEKVIYMGTFSRLLLPSLRISFMVLSKELTNTYSNRGKIYNQTASKTDQIALCQFIRDGHLSRQIKKTRKLYMIKSQQLCIAIDKVFGNKAKGIPGSGGFLIQMEVKSELSSKELEKRGANAGVLVRSFNSVNESKYPRLLLSCSGVSEDNFEEALTLLKYEFFRK
ncbi:PLP-dependent aminotransferase family protein [Clostridium algidicarnis]|uniref:MocR-like pyridoxine biosynthesis transcription factor PdxR n=1 Tax=Clostridium algidicarnis TaxID=37659 RepID=UPI001C0D3D90|nr:PLP-dependent aminotransferase family protein [Clostridium algidicarnis]MBU3196281.1 PLP-dependent aminotransferase family protein [Clostridium algidicarnis]MCB2286408.1 PLP-dependent aminotransferase family protein [Clostridium algidicarnis]